MLAQIHEQVDHLRLDRDIERGDRFVANEELRLHGKRAGDADAAALAARKLMRIAAAEIGIEADALQHLADIGRQARVA